MDKFLLPPKKARKKRKRIGRGSGSGHGTYATRGVKGSGQRSGKERDGRFEGGQTPLYRRIPKRGFKNIFKKEYEVVNIKILEERFNPGDEVGPKILKEKRITKKDKAIKILGDGKLTKPLIVKAHSFSSKAKKKIEEAGGKVEVISS